jgi:hypothetical protein
MSPLESPQMPAESGKADAPRRSPEELLHAMQQANEIRSARAQLKRDLASGRVELARIRAGTTCVRAGRRRYSICSCSCPRSIRCKPLPHPSDLNDDDA